MILGMIVSTLLYLLVLLATLLILSIIVVVHELGHFLVAKRLGIKVEEFGFGFPPRIIGKRVGETVYSINLLPIGGFVKLYGEDDAGGGKIGVVKDFSKEKKSNLKRAFFSRPAWQRGAVVVAGVVMNFLLASVILTCLFAFVGVTVPGKDVLIGAVVAGSPAANTGLKAGDTIISLNGRNVTAASQVTETTHNNLGKEMIMVIKNKNGQIHTIKITPRKNYPKNQGAMGIAIGTSYKVVKYPWYEAPYRGVKEAVSESWLIIAGLGKTVTDIFSKHQAPADIAGPVGITQIVGMAIKIGPEAVLSFMALISLNLAVLNILPIPALDGGRFFFILIEAVTRKKVNPQFEAYAHTAGMVVLMALILLVTLHDVGRLISGQPILPGM